jgi:cell division protein ZapA (FtsZ GTPase activity inhibitor)
MQIEEAIESVASSETITGLTAVMVMKDRKKLSSFINMINDQYNRDGNKDHLNTFYGKEVIETIINYGLKNNLIKEDKND